MHSAKETEEPISPPLRRDDAASYVHRTYGIPCTRAILAKLATIGGGPVFSKIGKYPLYAKDDLDAWIAERRTQRVRSTSELTGLVRENAPSASMEAA